MGSVYLDSMQPDTHRLLSQKSFLWYLTHREVMIFLNLIGFVVLSASCFADAASSLDALA